MDVLIKFILDKFPYLIFAAIVGIAVWRAARYHYTKVECAVKDSKSACDKLDKLPCKSHEDNITSVNINISKLGESTESVKDMLTEVTKWIMKFDINSIDVFVKKNSPYQITKVGFKILEESMGKSTIDSNLNFS